ncbi:General stress protein 26 [Flaviramulus basaltis]|uniref:General stress protein 26 n=1 Tax=Flaviramulus basaltis TaxID=369401 RepID=A0A1K2II17_9FLAO|nr:pyridoxamine 5'-phosphate oxidase family protein [Flaviramulus basaltis]SFZ91914.1 General stress protein 26 [Flaviramulus basaltis]
MKKENIYNNEAKAKIKKMAEAIDFAMMATNLDEKPFHAIPMSTKKVDDDGNIWFLSGQDSNHNTNIAKDNKIILIYSHPNDMSFLKLYGDAYIRTNKLIIEELYGKTDDTWFNGIDDPNLSAIQFKPIEAEYWEPKHNKIVSLFKMGLGAITGEEPDIEESGKFTL